MASDFHHTHEQTAIALLKAGNPAGAEARVRTMLSENPNDAEAFALLTYCRLNQDDNKGALAAACEAAKLSPDSWMVRRALLSALMRNGKLKEAEPIAEALAAMNPDDSSVLFNLAIARLNRHDYRGAQELFDQSEAAAIGDVHDLMIVAHHRLQQWRYAEAQELARQAMQLDPTRSDVFFILGECALTEKRADEAYRLALEALRIDPQDKANYRLVARAQARQDGWLKPFWPGIDWIVEMDRRGLFILPLFAVPIWAIFLSAFQMDLALALSGRMPVLVISLSMLATLFYGGVCYVTALSARWRIRRDLKKIALPNF